MHFLIFRHLVVSVSSNITSEMMLNPACDTSMEQDWMTESFEWTGMQDLWKDVNMDEENQVDK